ncbi:hypothetical protein HHK36_029480 [Tetracentron sinense]|uniref:DNA polymerase alpha subunit B n=1 Tax=Tetracentron sinense TaxID=13715 RepID=A0A834Y9M4_TETSI|nr:hypothetical protein HHK36_029480 [Tetracentron sinense]
MEEEIKAEFERNGFSLDEEEETLKKCLAFCINYKLGPSDLVSSWEVYFLNRQLNESTVQNAQMDGFLLHLQNEQKEAVIKEETHLHIYSSNDVDIASVLTGAVMGVEAFDNVNLYHTCIKRSEHDCWFFVKEWILSDEHEDIKEGILSTPTDRVERLQSEPSSEKPSRLVINHMTPFGQRINKFVVQYVFNNQSDKENGIREYELENHDDVIRRIQPSERCSLRVLGSRSEPGCRFMYDRIEDRFNSLENRIRRHATALVASGLYEDLMDPTVASQKSVFSVGMVCCDGEGHLNEKSIMLQGSVEHSGGQRVRLDLQKLNQFSFFPGQVVAIEGNNPSGHCLIASKVVDSIPVVLSPDVSMPPGKKQAMDQEIQPSPSSLLAELSLVIAAGPFTTTDNLLFEPLIELLAYASRKQPQLLVMLGPFVDSEHPEIKKGTLDRSFDEIFQVEILRKLQDYSEFMGPAARVLLVPSIRDANHVFVFPQPAFDIPSSDLKLQITCLANPGFFGANEVHTSDLVTILFIIRSFKLHYWYPTHPDKIQYGYDMLNELVTASAKPLGIEELLDYVDEYLQFTVLSFQVKVGCCTVDILRQLSGLEISRNPADGSSVDRMGRLARHVLSQHRHVLLSSISTSRRRSPGSLACSRSSTDFFCSRDSYTAVRPCSICEGSAEALLEKFVLSLGERMEGEEQVKCICVNPGRLTKGIGGGTFVELNYNGNPDKTTASIIRI